jgi:hypothetical protein
MAASPGAALKSIERAAGLDSERFRLAQGPAHTRGLRSPAVVPAGFPFEGDMATPERTYMQGYRAG